MTSSFGEGEAAGLEPSRGPLAPLLIVDDDLHTRVYLSHVLRSEGFRLVVIDLGPSSQFEGAAGARQLVLDERHQAIVGRCAHTMGPFVIDINVDGDRAVATGYVRVYISDSDMKNPRLWRIGYSKFELQRSDATWRIARRLSRSVGADDGAEVLRTGL